MSLNVSLATPFISTLQLDTKKQATAVLIAHDLQLETYIHILNEIMKEEEFLNSIEDLTGRVAIVTGGAKGIGLETSVYLALKGATVYIAARGSKGTYAGIEDVRNRLKSVVGDESLGSKIKYHNLDLGSMQNAWNSAREFARIESQLDILVCNAGVSMTTMQELSPDGFDTMFAVNHLGHFAFTTGLLDLIKQTSKTTQDSRIVFTNSNAYKLASPLDYEKLTTLIPNDGQTFKDASNAFKRYADSKLAALYGVLELTHRLRQQFGLTNIYINSCHPGNAIGTTLGAGHQKAVHPILEKVVRAGLQVTIGNSTADSAKTQVYLAGSRYIKDHDTYGAFWEPSFSWIAKAYKGCAGEEYTELARDEVERKKLWDVTVEAFKKAVGEDEIGSVDIVKGLIA
ncbi:short chain type dehydrogenase, putative [Talaromyces stipitatus ATCC 10500]|uniref:Short chain type dehydrogenase, putative n=1 Tax=Talaromyces stipitatus (strain ATCC 10500 / CBS 375.48 / QM 6759 / NRRL 1006) TaxID=441959 RepID=B8MTG7_TALSN|nr:short chain type dehydrogenase, putative [Talaromyces stipitatus ATCC 10500]EED12299.1 short chain type dehydrogenase, putative [Talaromyces stipitatus ATCC 10500]